MSIGKWITGAVGWALGGPIGGIIGFAIGSLLERGDPGSRGVTYTPQEERNSFLVSLLVLSSAVMKADGRIMKSELEYVKRFINLNFGPDAAKEAAILLRDLLKKEIDVNSVCSQIRSYMNYDGRIQLLHYLAGIALADGNASVPEQDILRRIAAAAGIESRDSESIFAMFGKGIDSAYKVLEIDPGASDDEIKKAYRKMAASNHPDKVSNLGADVQKAAEERFKSISEAYEKIKKKRGIV